VRVNGHVIADTDDALILHESNLPLVVYFPRQDVAMEYMGRTDHASHCPYKGDATYYTLALDGDVLDNVAWSYETPYEAVGPLAGRVAFYSNRVEIYSVDDAAVNPRHDREARSFDRGEVDEVVQHTDSGVGASQAAPWPPTVETPDQPEGGVR
jgi:uncharacterized protein (DUF427 family)